MCVFTVDGATRSRAAIWALISRSANRRSTRHSALVSPEYSPAYDESFAALMSGRALARPKAEVLAAGRRAKMSCSGRGSGDRSPATVTAGRPIDSLERHRARA